MVDQMLALSLCVPCFLLSLIGAYVIILQASILNFPEIAIKTDKNQYIVTCRGVRVTKITGSNRRLDLLAPRLQFLLISLIRGLSLIYTRYSSPLHTHWDYPSLLVVSWQQISTHKLVLQITMKSSCYFVFSHSVLLCPNLY
jgi:hypothetical protein